MKVQMMILKNLSHLDKIKRESASPSYLLTSDKVKRQIRPDRKYSYADCIAYALVAYEQLVDNEHRTYTKALKSKQAS